MPPENGKNSYGLLTPLTPHEMTLENGVYIPERFSLSHREATIDDAGCGYLCTFSFIFGQRANFKMILDTIKPINAILIVTFLSRLAVWLSRNGVRSCEKDKLQLDLLNAAICGGEAIGLSPKHDYSHQKAIRGPCASPESINALIALIIEQGVSSSEGDKDINQNLPRIALALSMSADIVFGTEVAKETMQDDLYPIILRQNLAQAPFLGTMQTFTSKIARFHLIYSQHLKETKPELKVRVESYLQAYSGITQEELMTLAFPVNICWINLQNFSQNAILAITHFPHTGQDIAEKLLSKISLEPEEYTNRMRYIKSQRGDEFFFNSATTALFVRYPFIRISNNEYLLIAPYFLVRWIELSIQSAFIDQVRLRKAEVRDLYGPRGIAFEAYINSMFIEKYPPPQSRILTGTFEPNPTFGSSHDELADGIIDDPENCVLLEYKFKPPVLAEIDVTAESVQKIRDWVKDTFFLTQEEARERRQTKGALWQLALGAAAIQSGERGYTPKSIIPIVIIADDFISPLPLYKIIDQEVERLGIFKHISIIRRYLIFSVSDLEYILQTNFTEHGYSLPALFKEIATHEGARQMPMPNFASRLGLEFQENKIHEKVMQELLEKATAIFGDTTQPSV